jgi:hypothetical protein
MSTIAARETLVNIPQITVSQQNINKANKFIVSSNKIHIKDCT